MSRSVACLLVLGAAGVYSQPDQTKCDNGAAYDTSTGKASCGGVQVDFFNLLCGASFSQQRCVAKWTDPGGEEEDFFFMAAGSGMSGSMLPTSCRLLPSGLAMVQYFPGSGGCYPVADLAGTQATYTAGPDGTPSSVTLTFAGYNGSIVTEARGGYVKIKCNQTTSGFTTSGDTNVQFYYEVDVAAPCGGPGPSPPAPPGPSPSPGPPGNYRCVNNTCQEGDGGSPYNNCATLCGVATYRCYDNTCAVAPSGVSKSDCQKVCRPQPHPTPTPHPGCSDNTNCPSCSCPGKQCLGKRCYKNNECYSNKCSSDVGNHPCRQGNGRCVTNHSAEPTTPTPTPPPHHQNTAILNFFTGLGKKGFSIYQKVIASFSTTLEY